LSLSLPPELQARLAAAGLPVKPTYRADEVSRLLSIPQRTVYRMIADGRLGALELRGEHSGKPTRVPLTAIVEALTGPACSR
jgi:excisionase family DNA binding protein